MINKFKKFIESEIQTVNTWVIKKNLIFQISLIIDSVKKKKKT